MKKIFSIASFPPRIYSLQETINSIINQADKVFVYLNDYDSIPGYLNHEKITVFLGNEYSGDIGDVGKFYSVDDWDDAYVFTCDDDIIYPSDYAEKMIAAVERYGRKAVVSGHGRIFREPRNITHYYKDLALYLGFPQLNAQDTFVHECGTGVMCFHTDTLTVDLATFKLKNCTDIQFGEFLQSNQIPCVVLAHRDLWIRPSLISSKHSISSTYVNNDHVKRNLANQVDWQIFTCNPVL